MQWTQIDIGRRLFWLVNALVLLIVLALVIALAVSDEGWVVPGTELVSEVPDRNLRTVRLAQSSVDGERRDP